MIIEALLNVIAGFLAVLLYPLQLAQLPDNIADIMVTLLGYLADGVAIVAAYTHFTFLVVLFEIVIAIDILYTLYIIVMWILRKIPFLGVS